MQNTGKLKLTTRGDREIVMTRVFDAPRPLVWEAHTKPELVKRWLLGPPGWSMPVCEIDLRVGGAYRYVWRREAAPGSPGIPGIPGQTGCPAIEMGMGGVYREILAPQRIVATEKFDDAWYPGEAVGTLILTENAGRTTLTQTVLYESREAREAVIKSPMESGVAAGYDRLADLLTSLGAPAMGKAANTT